MPRHARPHTEAHAILLGLRAGGGGMGEPWRGLRGLRRRRAASRAPLQQRGRGRMLRPRPRAAQRHQKVRGVLTSCASPSSRCRSSCQAGRCGKRRAPRSEEARPPRPADGACPRRSIPNKTEAYFAASCLLLCALRASLPGRGATAPATNAACPRLQGPDRVERGNEASRLLFRTILRARGMCKAGGFRGHLSRRQLGGCCTRNACTRPHCPPLHS